MIKLEKMRALIAENSHNLNAHQIIKISSVLYGVYVVLRDKTSLCFTSITI